MIVPLLAVIRKLLLVHLLHPNMQSTMIKCCADYEVTVIVVECVTVDMVNDLVWFQLPTESFLCLMAMLKLVTILG